MREIFFILHLCRVNKKVVIARIHVIVWGFFDAISRVIKSYCAAEDIDPKHPDLWFEGHVERHVDGGRVYWSFDHGT